SRARGAFYAASWWRRVNGFTGPRRSGGETESEARVDPVTALDQLALEGAGHEAELAIAVRNRGVRRVKEREQVEEAVAIHRSDDRHRLDVLGIRRKGRAGLDRSERLRLPAAEAQRVGVDVGGIELARAEDRDGEQALPAWQDEVPFPARHHVD